MQSDMANGENPAFTNLVGASAAPNQTPAVNPEITPRACNEIWVFGLVRSTVFIASPSFSRFAQLVQHHQQDDTRDQYEERNQKMAIGQDRLGLFSEAHSTNLSIRIVK